MSQGDGADDDIDHIDDSDEALELRGIDHIDESGGIFDTKVSAFGDDAIDEGSDGEADDRSEARATLSLSTSTELSRLF